MNDRDEIRAGRAALQESLKVREPELEDWQRRELKKMGISRDGTPRQVFLLSAALDGDLLTLWRSYGNGTEAEYAIDLEPNVPLWPVQQNDAEAHPAPPPPNWYKDAEELDENGQPFWAYNPDEPHIDRSNWGSVSYLDNSSSAAITELDRLIAKLERPDETSEYRVPFSSYLLGLDPTVFFKQPGFSDEREVRATWQVQPWWRFVLYRAGRFGVTPYIEVAAPNEAVKEGRRLNGLRQNDVGRLPIRSICIGPTRAADDAEHSLRAFLDAHGYGKVKILRSSTPYR